MSRWVELSCGEVIRFDDKDEHQTWINDKRIEQLKQANLLKKIYMEDPYKNAK